MPEAESPLLAIIQQIEKQRQATAEQWLQAIGSRRTPAAPWSAAIGPARPWERAARSTARSDWRRRASKVVRHVHDINSEKRLLTFEIRLHRVACVRCVLIRAPR